MLLDAVIVATVTSFIEDSNNENQIYRCTDTYDRFL